MRKTKTEDRTNTEQTPSTPTRCDDEWGHYQVYVRSDEINGELVEGLTPITWPEFLNRDLPEGATEEDLAQTLVVGEYYVVGKRLVKYLYTIKATRIIVCDLARLTPTPQDDYRKWQRRHYLNHPVDLDIDEYKDEQKQKQEEVKEKQKEITEITHDILV